MGIIILTTYRITRTIDAGLARQEYIATARRRDLWLTLNIGCIYSWITPSGSSSLSINGSAYIANMAGTDNRC